MSTRHSRMSGLYLRGPTPTAMLPQTSPNSQVTTEPGHIAGMLEQWHVNASPGEENKSFVFKLMLHYYSHKQLSFSCKISFKHINHYWFRYTEKSIVYTLYIFSFLTRYYLTLHSYQQSTLNWIYCRLFCVSWTLADHHQHHESENHSLHVFTGLYTNLCMEKSKGEKCEEWKATFKLKRFNKCTFEKRTQRYLTLYCPTALLILLICAASLFGLVEQCKQSVVNHSLWNSVNACNAQVVLKTKTVFQEMWHTVISRVVCKVEISASSHFTIFLNC